MEEIFPLGKSFDLIQKDLVIGEKRPLCILLTAL